jgi:hypothetical protein
MFAYVGSFTTADAARPIAAIADMIQTERMAYAADYVAGGCSKGCDCRGTKGS